MMIGLLGILKAGGCYVPLDPAYPKERLAFMLEDAQVPVLLTQNEVQAELNKDRPAVTPTPVTTTTTPAAPASTSASPTITLPGTK